MLQPPGMVLRAAAEVFCYAVQAVTFDQRFLMFVLLVPFLSLATSHILAPEPHETQALLEQYEQNAARCDTIACTDEELDGMDRDLLMLLGRRAAILRQRSRLAAALKKKGQKVSPVHMAIRRDWLAQKAKELSVPKALAQPVSEALIKAAEGYESEKYPAL